MIVKSIVLAYIVVGVLANSFEDGIPSERDDLKEQFKTICKQYGAEDKVDQVVNASLVYNDCLNGIVNLTTIDSNENDDRVFCAKIPQFKTCMYIMIDGMSPCMNQTNLNLTSNKNIADRLVDFICFKGAEKLSLFIEKKGPKCFADKWNAISTCISKMNELVSSDEAAKNLTAAEKCAKFGEVAICMVNSVKDCSHPSPEPNNFYESLASSYLEGTPCV